MSRVRCKASVGSACLSREPARLYAPMIPACCRLSLSTTTIHATVHCVLKVKPPVCTENMTAYSRSCMRTGRLTALV